MRRGKHFIDYNELKERDRRILNLYASWIFWAYFLLLFFFFGFLLTEKIFAQEINIDGLPGGYKIINEPTITIEKWNEVYKNKNCTSATDSTILQITYITFDILSNKTVQELYCIEFRKYHTLYYYERLDGSSGYLSPGELKHEIGIKHIRRFSSSFFSKKQIEENLHKANIIKEY